MFKPSERRTLYTPTTANAARCILREQLRPMLADAPRAWFGGGLTPGVRGLILGSYVMLVPVPPGRRLWSSRRSPTVIGRIVARSDGGADVRMSIYTPGYPYRTVKDSTATAFLHNWMSAVAHELDAEWSLSKDEGG
jgi:hypothetical protein